MNKKNKQSGCCTPEEDGGSIQEQHKRRLLAEALRHGIIPAPPHPDDKMIRELPPQPEPEPKKPMRPGLYTRGI